MATQVPPKKNTAFVDYIGLPSVTDSNVFQANPTIAAGDFKVSVDGGALSNLTTLPAVTPAASKMVKISLSASEMNGDVITVVCSDVAGAEWKDVLLTYHTSTRQIDDLAFPTVSGRSIDVSVGGEVGLDWANIGSPTTVNTLSGTAVNSVTAGVTVASGGIAAGSHTAAELNAIADAMLDRNMATGTDSGTDSTVVRTPRQALRASRNKVVIAAGVATTYKEDDVTASWTASISTTAGNPISQVDPA